MQPEARLSTIRPQETSMPGRQEVEDNMTHKLGEGSFGSVYKSTFEGAEVAVKTMPAGRFYEADFEIEKEALSKLRHEHVINFIRAFPSSKPFQFSLLVMQYASGGSLASLLYPSDVAPSPLRTDPERRATIATHIASGLLHIHNNHFVHRDVKPANVLLMADGTAKVSDVGLARILNPATGDASATVRGCGTPRYKAPEQHQGQHLSVKADVYAYGVLLNELESGMRPWQHMFDDLYALNDPSKDFGMEIQRLVCEGQRPWTAPDTRFLALIQRCWSPDQNDRPTMREVLQTLRGEGPASAAPPPLEPQPSTAGPLLGMASSSTDSLGLGPLVAVHARDSSGRTSRKRDRPQEEHERARACQRDAACAAADDGDPAQPAADEDEQEEAATLEEQEEAPPTLAPNNIEAPNGAAGSTRPRAGSSGEGQREQSDGGLEQASAELAMVRAAELAIARAIAPTRDRHYNVQPASENTVHLNDFVKVLRPNDEFTGRRGYVVAVIPGNGVHVTFDARILDSPEDDITIYNGKPANKKAIDLDCDVELFKFESVGVLRSSGGEPPAAHGVGQRA